MMLKPGEIGPMGLVDWGGPGLRWELRRRAWQVWWTERLGALWRNGGACLRRLLPRRRPHVAVRRAVDWTLGRRRAPWRNSRARP